MGIIWCGGEDLDFPNGNAPGIDTGGAKYRPTYARCAMSVNGASGFVRSVSVVGVTSVWLSGRLYPQTPAAPSLFGLSGAVGGDGLYIGPSYTSGSQLALWKYTTPVTWTAGATYAAGQVVIGNAFGFAGSVQTRRVVVPGISGASQPAWTTTLNATNTETVITGTPATWTYDGNTNGATQIALGTGVALTQGVLVKVDIQLISYGGGGTVNVWLGGALALTYTGDLTVYGVSNFTQACLIVPTVPFAGGLFMSEVIVSSTDTRTLSLCTLAPSGPGATDAWTGSCTDVNEIVVNDATAIFTNTANLDQDFTLTGLPTGTFTIQAQKIIARAAQTAGATADQVALGIRSGGTTAPGSPQALTTAWQAIESLMQTNPVTGAPWTQSDSNALQINLRSST
jgi:hypothetical protein